MKKLRWVRCNPVWKKKVAGHATTVGIDAHGERWIAGAIFGSELEMKLLAAHEAIEPVERVHQLYYPSEWLLRTFPEHRSKIHDLMILAE